MFTIMFSHLIVAASLSAAAPGVVAAGSGVAPAVADAAQPSRKTSGQPGDGDEKGEDSCDFGDKLNQLTLMKSLGGLISDGAGAWLEYAAVKGGVVDGRSSFRMSFIKDGSTGNLNVEIWLDKLGTVALRSRVSSDGKAVYELKDGSNVYLIPENLKETKETPDLRKKKCDIKKMFEDKIRESTHATESTIKVTTPAGTFNCKEVKFEMAQGSVSILVSDEGQVRRVIRFSIDGSISYQLVAFGNDAYSSFSPDAEAIPMGRIADMLGNVKDEAKDVKGGAGLVDQTKETNQGAVKSEGGGSSDAAGR